MSTKQYKNKNAISWRCFFCDEVFKNREEAALHFGVFDACEADEVACKLVPNQQKVLKYIRELENQVRDLLAERHEDSHPLLDALFDAQNEVNSREKLAEEKGYAKGVADMIKQGYCVESSKHK